MLHQTWHRFGAFLLIQIVVIAAAHARPLTVQLPDHLPGQVIVKLKSSNAPLTAQSAAVTSVIKKLGANSILSVRPLLTDKGTQVIRLEKTSDDDLKVAIAALKANPQIQYAEPNYVIHAFEDGVPNDPDFYKMWGMRNTGQQDPGGQIGTGGADINILPLWKEGFIGSHKTVVAVLDTGIDWNHPDLQQNIYTNPGEIPGNGLDNDHNGFVQDIHGWNFYDNNNESMDDHNHGTHCAGIIGAIGNNGVGIAGVNWNVSLMPVKFLNSSGAGSTEKAIDAINYATMMKANVISASWGGDGWSQGLYDAIKHARDSGVLFVAAAGNEGHNNDDQATYPASFDLDNMLSVAATDNRDRLAIFSNYGAETVHVAAPGVRVWSTVRHGDYATLSGTSMATPFVAGVAALVISAHSELNYARVKDRLIRTSTPISSLRNKVAAKGRINAYNAMHEIIAPNSAPNPALWKTEAYPVESDHPYDNDADHRYEIHRVGAKFIRIHFTHIETEAKYDHVYVEDSSGNTIEELSGQKSDYTSLYVTGERAYIHLRSDHSVNGFGFQVDKIQVIE